MPSPSDSITHSHAPISGTESSPKAHGLFSLSLFTRAPSSQSHLKASSRRHFHCLAARPYPSRSTAEAYAKLMTFSKEQPLLHHLSAHGVGVCAPPKRQASSEGLVRVGRLVCVVVGQDWELPARVSSGLRQLALCGTCLQAGCAQCAARLALSSELPGAPARQGTHALRAPGHSARPFQCRYITCYSLEDIVLEERHTRQE